MMLDNEHWIAFTDFWTGVASIFLVIVALLLALINPIVIKLKEAEGDAQTPGNLTVEASWREDVDVDLWVLAPGDSPVGYSASKGKYFNLLRDDLGRPAERLSGIHLENAYTRGLPDGEYVVNLHMYANSGGTWPIQVEITVTIVDDPKTGKASSKTFVRSKVSLTKTGEEATAVRFRVKDGNVVDGTANQIQKSLRSLRQTP